MSFRNIGGKRRKAKGRPVDNLLGELGARREPNALYSGISKKLKFRGIVRLVDGWAPNFLAGSVSLTTSLGGKTYCIEV